MDKKTQGVEIIAILFFDGIENVETLSHLLDFLDFFVPFLAAMRILGLWKELMERLNVDTMKKANYRFCFCFCVCFQTC